MTNQKPNRRKAREAALQVLFCNSFSDREMVTSVAGVQTVRTIEDLQESLAVARATIAAAQGVVRTIEHAIEALRLGSNPVTKAQIKVSPENMAGNLLHLADARREAIQTMRKAAGALETSAALFDDKGFALRLVREFQRQDSIVDSAIERALTGWSLRRLTAEDRAMLRLGTTELLFFHDVPPAVIIDQYIELSKDYGDKDSGKLLNGVLDRILRDNPRPAGAATPSPAPESAVED